MNYTTKNFHDLFNADPKMNCSYLKPAQCPHCGLGCDPVILGHTSISPFTAQPPHFVFLIFQCTACKKLFTGTYEIDDGHSHICCMTPEQQNSFSDEHIENMSPRFMEMYNQALRAKYNKDINLAAIGYRAALEILIKDYAINELHKAQKDVIRKDLFSAISEYLPADDFIKTADVIRILGNDHTHYKRKYPDLDFKLLQEYMDIFISLIRSKLLIAHPPVSR